MTGQNCDFNDLLYNEKYAVKLINDYANNKLIIFIRGAEDNALKEMPNTTFIVLQTDLLGVISETRDPELISIK